MGGDLQVLLPPMDVSAHRHVRRAVAGVQLRRLYVLCRIVKVGEDRVSEGVACRPVQVDLPADAPPDAAEGAVSDRRFPAKQKALAALLQVWESQCGDRQVAGAAFGFKRLDFGLVARGVDDVPADVQQTVSEVYILPAQSQHFAGAQRHGHLQGEVSFIHVVFQLWQHILNVCHGIDAQRFAHGLLRVGEFQARRMCGVAVDQVVVLRSRKNHVEDIAELALGFVVEVAAFVEEQLDVRGLDGADVAHGEGGEDVLFELLAVAGVGGGGQVRLGEDLQPLKGIGGKVYGLAGGQPVFQVRADVQYADILLCFLPGAVVWAKRAFEPLVGRVHVRSPL